MPKLPKTEAIKTIQHRRSQIRAVIQQEIPIGDLGPQLVRKMERHTLCAILSDAELNMLSGDYLNDVIENGWWSEVGRLRLRKLMENS